MIKIEKQDKASMMLKIENRDMDFLSFVALFYNIMLTGSLAIVLVHFPMQSFFSTIASATGFFAYFNLFMGAIFWWVWWKLEVVTGKQSLLCYFVPSIVGILLYGILKLFC